MAKKPQSDFVDIQLTTPVVIAGTEVKALRMREPTVADQLAVDEKGSNSAQEIAMFSNLCEISPDDIKRMKLRDYRKLQTAFFGFLD